MASEPAGLRNAGAIAATAVTIGLLAQWLFVDALLGINAPIALAALVAAAWLLRPAGRPLPRVRDAWLTIAALVFASFAALRGDTNLVDLDLLGALALGGPPSPGSRATPLSTMLLGGWWHSAPRWRSSRCSLPGGTRSPRAA